jgi:hypothetical protein
MPKAHRLKTWPVGFQAISLGLKTYEVRVDDRGFKVGDTLYLEEWNPASERYTGRSLAREVSYISRGPEWGLPEGVVVMALQGT